MKNNKSLEKTVWFSRLFYTLVSTIQSSTLIIHKSRYSTAVQDAVNWISHKIAVILRICMKIQYFKKFYSYFFLHMKTYWIRTILSLILQNNKFSFYFNYFFLFNHRVVFSNNISFLDVIRNTSRKDVFSNNKEIRMLLSLILSLIRMLLSLILWFWKPS